MPDAVTAFTGSPNSMLLQRLWKLCWGIKQRPEIYTQVFFTETFDAPKPPTSTDGLKDPEWALQGNPGTMIPDLDPEAVKILDLTQHPEYLTGDVCSAIISAKKDRIILFPAYDKVYD